MIFLSSVVNRCLDRLSSRFETGYLSVDCAIGSSAVLLPTSRPVQQHTEAKSMDWSMDWTTVFTGLLVLVTGGLVWVGDKYRTLASCNAHTLVLCPAESPPQPVENCLPTWNLRMWATCLHLSSNRY